MYSRMLPAKNVFNLSYLCSSADHIVAIIMSWARQYFLLPFLCYYRVCLSLGSSLDQRDAFTLKVISLKLLRPDSNKSVKIG